MIPHVDYHLEKLFQTTSPVNCIFFWNVLQAEIVGIGTVYVTGIYLLMCDTRRSLYPVVHGDIYYDSLTRFLIDPAVELSIFCTGLLEKLIIQQLPFIKFVPYYLRLNFFYSLLWWIWLNKLFIIISCVRMLFV